MLEKLCVGHPGIERTLKRAHAVLLWPGISADVRKFVSKYPECMSLQNSNPKELLMPHPVPDYPWQVVGINMFH